MATPWNSGTAYSPGAVVSYNGLEYVRSIYPPAATSGTPPNEEMGVDQKGDAIRTWTLLAGDYIGGWRPKFMTMYFRLIGATWNTTDATPEFFYSGPQSYAVNGYQVVREPGYPYGESVEWDQFKDNASPTPDSPVCPANKCGVAMQQFQEISGEIPPSPPDPVYFLPVIIAEADHVVKEDDDRIYYVYVRVNHPLYFRRSLTVLTRVKKTKSLPLPAETTYINTYTTYVPTDKNYVTNTYGVLNQDYFTPANAAYQITLPDDVDEPDDKVVYTMQESEIVDATSND
jgi:hypothetical protein